MSGPAATIWLAEADEQIARCFPVMLELRPHLAAGTFVRLVRAMRREGYILTGLEADGEVRAVAGFRINLLHWLIQYARDRDRDSFDLDSDVQRFRAHRLCFREGMHINSYHFTLGLREE